MSLDDGFISDSSQTHNLIINGPGDTTFADAQGAPDLLGTWAPLTSVPEPASAVLAGIGGAIGLVLAAFRKRKGPAAQRIPA
jgi:hypothetical protein